MQQMKVTQTAECSLYQSETASATPTYWNILQGIHSRKSETRKKKLFYSQLCKIIILYIGYL